MLVSAETLPVEPLPVTVLGGVVAVVGCDGSGKSTLCADLVRLLGGSHPVEFMYLGQSSGIIGRRIAELPVAGPWLAGLLKSRSTRAHADDGRPAAADGLTAFVVYLLSRGRYRKFRRLLALDRRGSAVIVDRFPQAEVAGFYFDGPGLSAQPPEHRLARRLAAHELDLYRWMASHHPGLVIRLNVDADTAFARKPDHKLAMLRDKARVLPTLSFGGAPILDLDATAPYPEVLASALAAAREVLGRRVDPLTNDSEVAASQ